MHQPGIEPGSQRWQRRIRTVILPVHRFDRKKKFLNLSKVLRDIQTS